MIRHAIAAALLIATPAAARPVDLVSACFTPGDNCTSVIVQAINEAHTSVRVLTYVMTSAPIVEALTAAQARGVDVRMIIDVHGVGAHGSRVADIASAGIAVLVDHPAGLEHNKVLIIDGARVLTGSFNFSASAQSRNAENLLEIDDGDLAAAFLEHWQKRARVSAGYAAPGQAP